jgi:hypothetical protein
VLTSQSLASRQRGPARLVLGAVLYGLLQAGSSACDPACPPGTVTRGKFCVSSKSIEGSDAGVLTGGFGGLQGQAGVPSTAGIGGAGPGTAGQGGSVGQGTAGQNGTAGQAGSAPAAERCTTDGAMRCAVAAGQREHCSAGVWSPAAACAPNEVCAGATSNAPGSCQPVADVCRGSGGQAVCDGQGVMYQCSAQGVVDSQQKCASAQHCQKGLAAHACVTCIPGETRCTETRLERCDDKGSAFTLVKDCGTPGLCKAAAADCTTAACVANTFTCEGDKLRQCNKDQTAFEDVKACAAGLCDKAGGQCDVCVAGTKHCENNSIMICNATGQAYDSMPCSGSTTHCVGNGQCVACASDADCPAPAACAVKHCNVGTGACEPQPAPKQTACGSSKMCDGAGMCVECLADSDCGDPGLCKVKSCNQSTHTCQPQNAGASVSCGGGKHCDRGECVQCSSGSDCVDQLCQSKACVSGECRYSAANPGTRDPGCPSGQVCSSSQSCVECTDSTQCAGKGDGHWKCARGTCKSSCSDGTLDAWEDCEVSLTSNIENARYCDATTCKWRSVYTCSEGPGCTPPCSSVSDCPKPYGSETVTCASNSNGTWCEYSCGTGTSNVCPPGGQCATFICKGH